MYILEVSLEAHKFFFGSSIPQMLEPLLQQRSADNIEWCKNQPVNKKSTKTKRGQNVIESSRGA